MRKRVLYPIAKNVKKSYRPTEQWRASKKATGARASIDRLRHWSAAAIRPRANSVCVSWPIAVLRR